MEFDTGFDAKAALVDVREKVDTARSKLPEEAAEPIVSEVNVALFPVLSFGLSGPIAETQLVYVARRLQENIEGIAEVLSVKIGSDHEDLLETFDDDLPDLPEHLLAPLPGNARASNTQDT